MFSPTRAGRDGPLLGGHWARRATSCQHCLLGFHWVVSSPLDEVEPVSTIAGVPVILRPLGRNVAGG